MNLHLDAYKDRHVGQHAFLIGKGPSLDDLWCVKLQLQRGVIFALNESVHEVEKLTYADPQPPIYCVQQDSELEAACVPRHPDTIHFMNDWQSTPDTKGVKIRVSISQWHPKAVLYRYPEWHLSAVAALDIMAWMGICDVTLVAFDGLLKDGPMTYAKCIPYRKSIHKPQVIVDGALNSLGNHRANGGDTLIKAKAVMLSLKTLHPRVPEVEF